MGLSEKVGQVKKYIQVKKCAQSLQCSKMSIVLFRTVPLYFHLCFLLSSSLSTISLLLGLLIESKNSVSTHRRRLQLGEKGEEGGRVGGGSDIKETRTR